MRRTESGVWRIGRFGYPVEISVWFCVALCAVLILDKTGDYLYCLSAAAVHELGHLSAMALCKCRHCRVRLTVLGIRLERPPGIENGWKTEILIDFAGPLANFLLFGLFTLLGKCFRLEAILQTPGEMQAALGAINLLPIYPLDGGQAVYAFLQHTCAGKADRIADVLTVLFLLPTAVCGILVLFRSPYNWSLLGFALYLTVFFIFQERY